MCCHIAAISMLSPRTICSPAAPRGKGTQVSAWQRPSGFQFQPVADSTAPKDHLSLAIIADGFVKADVANDAEEASKQVSRLIDAFEAN